MAMTEASREVGVVVRRRTVDNPWVDHVWSPAMVLDEVPARRVDRAVHRIRCDDVHAGAASIDLFSSDTANYRDNLPTVSRASAALGDRRAGPNSMTKVTADPTEGEAIFESGCDVIGTVPMSAEIAAWIAAFVDEFHVERAFHKRKRDRADGDRPRGPRDRGPDQGTGRA